MAESPSVILSKRADEVRKFVPDYIRSKEFEKIADDAVIDFVKRVKRALTPTLSPIKALKKEYIAVREKYSKNLGDLASPGKSNATATGQMLKAFTKIMTPKGFIIYPKDTHRKGELNNSKSRNSNQEVAAYYNIRRPIFDFSKPEFERIMRKVKSDLLKLIKNQK